MKTMNTDHILTLFFTPFWTFLPSNHTSTRCHNCTFSYMNKKYNKDRNSQAEVFLCFVIFFLFCFFFFPWENTLQQLPALHRLYLALNGLIPSIFDLHNIFTHCLHFIGSVKVTRQFKPASGASAECPTKVSENFFSVMQTLMVLSLRIKK